MTFYAEMHQELQHAINYATTHNLQFVWSYASADGYQRWIATNEPQTYGYKAWTNN